MRTKKITVENWKEELSKVCNEIKELKRKYARKRSGTRTLFSHLIRRRFNKWMPLKYPSGKRPPLIKYIDAIQHRSYIFGFREAEEIFKKKIAKIDSTYSKDINRIRETATLKNKRCILLKHYVKQTDKLFQVMLKDKRITKKELSKYFKKKEDIKIEE